MRFIRNIYNPGKDLLTYGAVDPNAANVLVRVYYPNGRLGDKEDEIIPLTKLGQETGIFVTPFEFKELGNYIFVVEEDGVVQTVLNARIIP